jgi:hypothetical protein
LCRSARHCRLETKLTVLSFLDDFKNWLNSKSSRLTFQDVQWHMCIKIFVWDKCHPRELLNISKEFKIISKQKCTIYFSNILFLTNCLLNSSCNTMVNESKL